MKKHNATDFILGYELDSEYGPKFKARSLTGDVSRSRTKFTRTVIRIAESLLKTLSYSSTRGYGLFLLSFGLFSFVLHVVANYTSSAPVPLYVAVCSVVLLVLGIPLVCFDRPIAIAFQDFTPTDVLFFEFFCLKRMHRVDVAAARRSEKESERIYVIRPLVWLVFGLLLSAFTMLLPMWTILLSLGALAYLFLTFVSPEFSFLAIIMALPYLPLLDYCEYLLAGAVLVTFLSFVMKVALGKRVYHFEQYDILLAVFLILVLISGVFLKGIESFTSSLLMILFAMGYVLASSLVSNRRLADCVVAALVVSSAPVSVYAIITGVRVVMADGYRGFAGVSATFTTPSDLAIYLLAVSVFALYYVRVRRRMLHKLTYLLIFVLDFAALIATSSTWAFVAGLFGVFAYCASGLKRGGPLLNAVIALLPYSLLFFGSNALATLDKLPVLKAVGFTELASRWGAAINMLRDNLLLGVGIGSDSFVEELGKYSAESFPDSASFLLEIGCEAGIIALSVLALTIVARVIHRMMYRKYITDSAVHHLTAFSSVAMTVLLVFGAVNYLWSEPTLTYLYWLVFGIGSAVLRISKREHDDRIAYFSDGRTSDSSSIDVEV